MCFADLTFNAEPYKQPPSPHQYSDTFMNWIPLMNYRGMWLGCDLIFHRESAEAVEALKCGVDRDGLQGAGLEEPVQDFFPPGWSWHCSVWFGFVSCSFFWWCPFCTSKIREPACNFNQYGERGIDRGAEREKESETEKRGWGGLIATERERVSMWDR